MWLEQFEPLVGQEWLLQPVPGAAPLHFTLTEARDTTPRSSGPATFEGFSLLFRGPRDPVMQQGTYSLEHPKAGRVEIFLVPVGRDAQGVEYEAIFSRRAQGGPQGE